MTTVSNLLTEARSTLSGPEAALEAEWLMDAICGVDRTRQFSHPYEELTPEQVSHFHAAMKRRLSGEPLAYIIGYRDFWDMRLVVTPDVLIPQPDTEMLVEQALARIPDQAAWNIADLGAGSGAVALALARERKACHVLATDVSDSALKIAAANAAHYELDNVLFVCADWLAAIAPDSLDMIVSNPPYIADDDVCLVSGDVSREPRTALAAGSDGLDDLKRIVVQAVDCLNDGGWLLVEHGFQQADEVSDLLSLAGYSEIFTARDYAGNDRVSGGKRPDGYRFSAGIAGSL